MHHDISKVEANNDLGLYRSGLQIMSSTRQEKELAMKVCDHHGKDPRIISATSLMKMRF